MQPDSALDLFHQLCLDPAVLQRGPEIPGTLPAALTALQDRHILRPAQLQGQRQEFWVVGVVQLIQVGPYLLQPLEDGEAALQPVHPAVPLCGMAQPHSGQELQGALILLGRDREGDSCLAVLRVCRVAQDTAQHRPSVLCGHICCPPVSWPWGVM